MSTPTLLSSATANRGTPFIPFGQSMKAPLSSVKQREVRVVADHSLDITGSFLEITVGKDDQRETFFVHESLFVSRSEFIKRAAKEERLQQKRTISLPEDKPAAFRLYTVLSYAGLLTTKNSPAEWSSLVDVYILAEKLQDVWAKNLIIDAMHSYASDYLSRLPATTTGTNQLKDSINAMSLATLYNNTPVQSQARRLVVDLFANNGTDEWLKEGTGLYPPDFLFNVTIRLLQKRTVSLFGNVLHEPSSHYHECAEKKEPAVKDAKCGVEGVKPSAT